MDTVFVLTALLVALVVVIGLAGAVAKANLKRQFPPVGQLIDVGGYRLHINVQGQQHAGPTVVLDSGTGGFGVQWALVQPAVAQFARVVAYDRAGYGWSDPSPRQVPRDVETLAQELHTLLQKANLPGPYILVGHSLGGVVARQFAQHDRACVAGLVLVDSAHEQQPQRFPPELVKMMASMKTMLGVMKFLNVVGIQALHPKMLAGDQLGPQEMIDVYRALIATNPHHFPTTLAESEAALVGAAAPAPLGSLPLVVLSHGLPQDVPMAKPEVNRAYEEAWQTMQAELAALSPDSQRRVVENAGHNIQIDQPQAVVEAIRAVWQKAQSARLRHLS